MKKTRRIKAVKAWAVIWINDSTILSVWMSLTGADRFHQQLSKMVMNKTQIQPCLITIPNRPKRK